MQNPAEETANVVGLLTASVSPAILHQTVNRFFLPDASLRHPLSYVDSGPGSRDRILGVYEWYRIVSPSTRAEVRSLTYEEENNVVVADVVQFFHIRFSPFPVAPSRLIVRLELQKQDGLFYIKKQEDFFLPEDLAKYIFPPIAPLVHFALGLASSTYNVGSWAFYTLSSWRQGYSPMRTRAHNDGDVKTRY